jgi:hypothetical protein
MEPTSVERFERVIGLTKNLLKKQNNICAFAFPVKNKHDWSQTLINQLVFDQQNQEKFGIFTIKLFTARPN